MRYERAIVICGKIRSGKSFLASTIQNSHRIPIASFSGFLTQRIGSLGLTPSRAVLQDLGEELVKEDPKKFLTDVIQFTDSNHETMIFEGVRHQSILLAIQEKFDKTQTIYLDISENIRLERYLASEKIIDSEKSLTEFYTRSAHIVESDISNLIPHSDHVVTNNREIENCLFILNKFLA